MTDHNTETNPRKLEPELLKDTRYVYGARCTWHGPISAVGRTEPKRFQGDGVLMMGGSGLPCCPHCGGVLFEFPNKETWDNMAAQFDKKHPGYIEFIEWLGSIGRCYPNPVAAADAYKEATGKEVNLGT